MDEITNIADAAAFVRDGVDLLDGTENIDDSALDDGVLKIITADGAVLRVIVEIVKPVSVDDVPVEGQLLSPGFTLVHDPGDPTEPFSCWSYVQDSQRDYLEISWLGTRMVEDWRGHSRAFGVAFTLRQITQEQFDLLVVAALHGAFHRVARRMWAEMDHD